MTIHLDLTREFNRGGLRAIICSDQAVVLHRLAVMSKDGDWILREEQEACDHVLAALEGRGARYRFGAPLDPRWLRGGWSSHFEFAIPQLRVRTDFFTRPPRIDAAGLARLWREQEGRDPPFVDAPLLAAMKQTEREKDYAVIGELARLMIEPEQQLLWSRSARDLLALGLRHPELCLRLRAQRPLLALLPQGPQAIETALDAERRSLMHSNERRLDRYRHAGERLASVWPPLGRELAGLPLRAAHGRLVAEAERLLPQQVQVVT